jgi:hypothetical protein
MTVPVMTHVQAQVDIDPNYPLLPLSLCGGALLFLSFDIPTRESSVLFS